MEKEKSVLITVYVSATGRQPDKGNTNEPSTSSTTPGYNRKAQLLAYSRELRRRHHHNSQPDYQQDKKLWSTIKTTASETNKVNLCLRIRRLYIRLRRYGRIVLDGKTTGKRSRYRRRSKRKGHSYCYRCNGRLWSFFKGCKGE